MIRELEEQFQSETVARIRDLIERLESVQLPVGASRIYANELAYCLDAGALLASLHLAGSVLEVSARHKILEMSKEAKSNRTEKEIENEKPTLEERLEERKDLSFYDLCDALVEYAFWAPEDGERAKEVYRKVRIPVHHGLPTRFIKAHSDSLALELHRLSKREAVLFGGRFEESVHDNAIDIVEEVVEILDENLV